MMTTSSLLAEIPVEGVPCSESFSVSGDVSYMALDADGDSLLLQAGGSEGEHGLTGVVWHDGARHRYLYRFGSTDHQNIRAFAERIDRAFLPRPSASSRHRRRQPAPRNQPARRIRRAFAPSKSTGINLASTVAAFGHARDDHRRGHRRRDGENPTAPGHTRVSIRHLYHAGLWAAIRAGLARGLQRRGRPLHRLRRRTRRIAAPWSG